MGPCGGELLHCFWQVQRWLAFDPEPAAGRIRCYARCIARTSALGEQRTAGQDHVKGVLAPIVVFPVLATGNENVEFSHIRSLPPTAG